MVAKLQYIRSRLLDGVIDLDSFARGSGGCYLQHLSVIWDNDRPMPYEAMVKVASKTRKLVENGHVGYSLGLTHADCKKPWRKLEDVRPDPIRDKALAKEQAQRSNLNAFESFLIRSASAPVPRPSSNFSALDLALQPSDKLILDGSKVESSLPTVVGKFKMTGSIQIKCN